jgi:tetratricopeptide (TPR) repeat protein
LLSFYVKNFFSRMKSSRQLFILLPAFLLSWFFIAMVQKADAAPATTTVETLNIAQIQSVSEMETAIKLLENAAPASERENRVSLASQQIILSKSGECIGKLMTLQEATGREESGGKKKALTLLSQIRAIIGTIQEINKKTVSGLQENQLDKLQDPTSFFNSEAWQKPNYLISLSDYWLGWSGYYASLLYDENAPQRRKVLTEAIESFSRSNIDFAENAIITKSIFGRALCYKGLKSYEKAVQDLKAVKEKTGKTDDLYFRCLHEEAFISFETGNFGQALKILDRVQEDASGGVISKDIQAGFEGLRAKILLSQLEKDSVKEGGTTSGKSHGGKTEPVSEEKFRETFERLRKLSTSNKSLTAEYYRYVQSYAEKLSSTSPTELGSIGTLAIADLLFDKQQYAGALPYYAHLNTPPGMLADDLMGDASFRLAYIYCKQKQWAAALPPLEIFIKKAPKSASRQQAARLYYMAASQLYSENKTDKTYSKFIDATRHYLEECANCPDQSEAHFQMGRYYQKAGKTENAAREYSLVKEDSSNYGFALHHLLLSKVEALENLKDRGQEKSETAGKLYKDGEKLITTYRTFSQGKNKALPQNTLEADMILLQAQLHSFGANSAFKESLQQLDDFEKHYPSEKQMGAMAIKLRIDGYHKLGMFKEAEAEINRITAQTTVESEQYAFLQDLANRFYREARAHRNTEAKAQASRDASMALVIYKKLDEIASKNPGHKEDSEALRLRMAEIYCDEGNADTAIKLYQEVLNENPHSANAVFSLGEIHEKAGEWEKALGCWQRFSDGVKSGTSYWYDSRYRTARALIALGKNDKACTLLKMTRVLHPEFGDAAVEKKFNKLSTEICPKDTP